MRKYFFLFSILFLILSCDHSPKPKSTNNNISTISPGLTNEPEKIVAPTDAFIKKYEGTIGDTPINFILFHWGNGLLGGYYFSKKGNQVSQKIELSGELNLNETFIIDEYSNDQLTGKFEGSLFELSTISGIWTNSTNSNSMNFSLSETSSEDPTGWSGAWYRNSAHSPGILIMGNVTNKTVDFGLEVTSGGHNGLIEGTAKLNGSIATFKNPVFDETEECYFVFQKNGDLIRINQKSENWACGFGMRANAEGKYENQFTPEKLEFSYGGKDDVFTTNEQLGAFKKLVGEYYETFAFNMQLISKIQKNSKDQFNADVYIGNVAGLATLNEAIIMINKKNEIWAAVIDYDKFNDEYKIKYFTNKTEMKNTLPWTIEEWREGFTEYEVVM